MRQVSLFCLCLILGAIQTRYNVPKDAVPAGKASVTSYVTLEVEFDGEPQTKLVEIGLFGNEVPKTVENFRRICKGDFIDEEGHKLTYAGTPFHRIIPGFVVQGGDAVHRNGRGKYSIYQGVFKDENFRITHETGCVSMANTGKDTNGSQFFIPTTSTPHLDGQHVVFGRVTQGLEVISEIEKYGSKHGDPTKHIVVKSCTAARAATIKKAAAADL